MQLLFYVKCYNITKCLNYIYIINPSNARRYTNNIRMTLSVISLVKAVAIEIL